MAKYVITTAPPIFAPALPEYPAASVREEIEHDGQIENPASLR
jgi:hypothetical protein